MRVTFDIALNGTGAAFEDAPRAEIARILREVRARIANGNDAGTIRDINGNTCGRWSLDIAPTCPDCGQVGEPIAGAEWICPDCGEIWTVEEV